MNAILKFLIYTALLTGILIALSLFTISSWGQQVNSVSIWLLSSILPFKGMVNLSAFFTFITELMVFELAYWTYHLLNKLITIYTGNNLHHGNGTRNIRN